jgi:hypothetical protein
MECLGLKGFNVRIYKRVHDFSLYLLLKKMSIGKLI